MSLDCKQRVAMLEFRELILGPLPMFRALQQEPGFSRVPDYLALVAEGKDGGIVTGLAVRRSSSRIQSRNLK